jgi:putative Holliday junction resolvase
MRAGWFVGLDVGTKTIGVARASARGPQMASPQFTLRREGLKRDVPRLWATAAQWGAVETWVVGLPFELDGTEGRSARLARQVGEAIAALGGVVEFQDERFSTVEATRRLQESGLDARRQREVIDSAAAAVILEDWLGRTRGEGATETNAL